MKSISKYSCKKKWSGDSEMISKTRLPKSPARIFGGFLYIFLFLLFTSLSLLSQISHIEFSEHVYEFNPDGRHRQHSFNPKGPNPISSSCVADAENTMWAVYSPHRLRDEFSIYYSRADMDQFALLPDQEIITRGGKFGKVYFDGKDLWYRGDPFHLFRRNTATGKFEDLTDMVLQQANDFPFYNSMVNNVFRDRSGQVWITSRAGEVKMSLEEDIFRYYSIVLIGAPEQFAQSVGFFCRCFQASFPVAVVFSA